MRILKFNAQSPGESGAGIPRGDDDVEIRLDWSDEDSLPDLIEIFRAAICEAFDTKDVLTEEERTEEYKRMEATMPPFVCEECGAEGGEHGRGCTQYW